MAFGFGVGVQRLGSIAVPSLSALTAISPGAGVRPTGFVYADATPANNGVYTWSGSAWSRQRGLPDGVGSFTGVAGSNTITATLASGVDPAVLRAAILVPAANNTGAVTLNGEALKNKAGGALGSGALVAGVAALLMRDGSQWRLMTGSVAEINDVTGLQVALDGKFATADVDTDSTFAANSDARVPSQKAVRSAITARISTGYLDTDGTLAANSDTKLATQKAVKTYVDQIVAAQDAMVFKGVIDCSANPNYPAADRGWTYRVSVAGKIGGASGVNVEAGDILICLTDATASGNHATVGAQWGVIQANLDGALLSADIATAAQYLANTANKLLSTDKVWSAAVPVNLGGTLSGNISLNFSNFINAYGTATGNIVFNAVSNVKQGQSGIIEITASGGDRTVGYNTSVFAVAGSGTLPTIVSGTKQAFGYYGLQGGKVLLWPLAKGY